MMQQRSTHSLRRWIRLRDAALLVAVPFLGLAGCGGSDSSSDSAGSGTSTSGTSTSGLGPSTSGTSTSGSGTSTSGTSGSGTSGSGTSDGCPDELFVDLSQSAGAGDGYAKPSVSASCSDSELLVKSNGMISYEFVQKTPNALGEQDWNWHVPVSPKVADTSTDISKWFGTVGFTVTGIPIYAAMEGAQPADEAFGDPVYNGLLDSCKGHTGPASEYHLHALNTSSDCGFEPSPIVGYALDGFPIYGSNGCLDTECKNVVTFKSGYKQTGDPKTDAWANYAYESGDDETVLDECNGRIGPDGTYRYYATDTFPYTFGCFKGTPTTQTGAAGGPMPAMGGPAMGGPAMNGPAMGGPPMGGPASGLR